MIFSYLASFFSLPRMKNAKQIIFGKIQKKIKPKLIRQGGR
jgi:hypothetical protein